MFKWLFNLFRRNRATDVGHVVTQIQLEATDERQRLHSELMAARRSTAELEASLHELEERLNARTEAVHQKMAAILASQTKVYEDFVSLVRMRAEQQTQTATQVDSREATLTQLQKLQEDFASELAQMVQRYRLSVRGVDAPGKTRTETDRRRPG